MCPRSGFWYRRSVFVPSFRFWSRAAKVKTGGGGFPIWTCPSFLVLFCPFGDFPDLSGIFPICSGMVWGFSQLVLFLFLGLLSGTKKEHKPKLLSPNIFRWGSGLPHEGVGQKVRYVPRNQEIKLLGGVSRDFAGISRR